MKFSFNVKKIKKSIEKDKLCQNDYDNLMDNFTSKKAQKESLNKKYFQVKSINIFFKVKRLRFGVWFSPHLVLGGPCRRSYLCLVVTI